MKLFIYSLLFIFPLFVSAQQFTVKQYAFRVDSNVVFATDTNYLGYPEDLSMHIYKPIGDSNMTRPILVYVHGGSWLGGSPNEYYPTRVSEEFVKRGYVVANIRYRLGMHTNPTITPGINCPLIAGNAVCAYVSDTAEVLRAAFRAMQDAKSAIRFMKGRTLLDSTCAQAVFIAGESAGAFTALGATFLSNQSERFSSCDSLADAPASSSSLSFCQNLNNHLPIGQTPNYTRPDLGSVEGKTNLNGFDSKVKAVAAFYGAVFTEAVSKNWINGADSPAVYLFHQGNDFVVGCGTARPIVTLNQCIPYVNLGFNDCVGYSNVPWAYGSCAINSYLQSINYPNFKFAFVNNWTGNTLIDCANTTQAGQGHNIDNIVLRCDSVAKMFSPLAVAAIQSCMPNSIAKTQKENVILYPVPATKSISLKLKNNQAVKEIRIYNHSGIQINNFDFQDQIIHVEKLVPGIYFVEVKTTNEIFFRKFLIAASQ
jgi:hypothetical protein